MNSRCWRTHGLAAAMLMLCMILSACGTKRMPQTEQSLFKQRDDYRKSYLDETTVDWIAHNFSGRMDYLPEF